MSIDLMQCAERSDNIPKEQYISSNEKKSIMEDVNKRLLYDVIYLQRQRAILCSNEAKYCYERIVHSVVSMSIQQMGMTAQPMKFMLGRLQDLEHPIRTAYVTSESSMHNDSPIPLQGICQGNGAGPNIWVAVSSPLI